MEAEAEAEAAEMARIAALEKDGQEPDDDKQADPPKPTDTTPAKPDTTDTNTPHPQPEKAQESELEQVKAQLAAERVAREQAENRWRTADGMLRKRESEKDEQLKAMAARLEALEKRPTEPAKPREPAYLKHLDPDERRAITEEGKEPLEVRAARGEIEESETRVLKTVEERLAAKLKEVQEQAAAEQQRIIEESRREARSASVFAKVEELSPGFKAEDADPNSKWRVFLAQPDPDRVDGGTYLESAKEFLSLGNARGIAQLRNEYLSLNPGGKRDQLEGQVKPDTVRASGKPQPTNGKVTHTMSEYKAFYDDLIHHRIKPNADGSPRTAEQIAALQAELDDAYHNGELVNR